MSTCVLCRREIVWAGTDHGRRIALDVEPVVGAGEANHYVLRDEGALALAVPFEAFPDEQHFTSHFDTCPRRGRRPADEEHGRREVHRFQKNSNEDVVAALTVFHGKPLADVRVVRVGPALERPTTKGLTIAREQLPELRRAVDLLIEAAGLEVRR